MKNTKLPNRPILQRNLTTVVKLLTSLAILLMAFGHILSIIHIDAIDLALFSLIFLIWFGPSLPQTLKSLEAPGGLKIEFRDLIKIKGEADEAGLLATPLKKTEIATYIRIAEQNPTAGLALLRIEIEQRLVKLAEVNSLPTDRGGIGKLTSILEAAGVVSAPERQVLLALVDVLNRAVHGITVDPGVTAWAIDIGGHTLASLDKKIANYNK